MERRYLVAALAIIATFAVTSRGFRALENISLVRAAHAGVMAKSRCQASPAARAIAKIGTHLRPRFPEEAQLLAEMNAPLDNMRTGMDERMTQRDVTLAEHAQAMAMQDAERAYRDAMRTRDRMLSATPFVSLPSPVVPPLPPDLGARMQQRAVALAAQVAANNVKLQMSTEKLRGLSVQEFPVVEVTDDGGRITTHVHVRTRNNCKTSTQTPAQTE